MSRRCHRIRVITLLLYLSLLPTQLWAIFCYRCLALKCGPENSTTLDNQIGKECKELRQVVAKTLGNYYDPTNGDVLDCPRVNDLTKWEAMGQGDECYLQEDSSTCSVGRMRIKYFSPSSQTYMTTHATVLNCAQSRLLAAIKDRQCDKLLSGAEGGTRSVFQVELEHCSEPGTSCKDDDKENEDFCAEPQQSEIREFPSSSPKSSGLRFWAIVGIGVFLGLVLLVFVGASFCPFAVRNVRSLRIQRDGDNLSDIEIRPATVAVEESGSLTCNSVVLQAGGCVVQMPPYLSNV